MDQKLQDKLNKRIQEGTIRSLSLFDDFVDFYSNDYLGLSKLKNEVSEYSSYASSGSRLISGTSKESLNTERNLADFFGVESALVYNSGYDANLGFFSSVPQKGDEVFYDEYIHASIRDGIRLSFASNFSFKHNDLKDLESRISKSTSTKYVVIESLYSMDGDISPLQEIADLCSRYNAFLIVDEAHACGVIGEEGKGFVSLLGLETSVFARVVTFGKAYGAHGACVLGAKNLIEYLINFSRSFIYTTALPPDSYSRILFTVLHPEITARKNRLQEIINYFRDRIYPLVCASDVISPIQSIRIGNIEKTKAISEKLQRLNIAVKPIFSPTVPIGNEGLRICLHAFNTEDQIDILVNSLKDFIN